MSARIAIVREVGTCLRLIECDPETPIWYPDALQDVVYDFWDTAQADILSEWTRETDPANLQPRVRPLNLRVAEFIRANPVVGIPDEEVSPLTSGVGRREEICCAAGPRTEKVFGYQSLSSNRSSPRASIPSSPLSRYRRSRQMTFNSSVGSQSFGTLIRTQLICRHFRTDKGRR